MDEHEPLRWDYRIIRHTEPDGEVWYSICEVFYDRHGLMSVFDDAALMGRTPDELLEEIDHVAGAFDKPIVPEEAIPEEGAIDEFAAAGEAADEALDKDGKVPPRGVDDILEDLEEF